jgi:hypothetical protein
MACTLPLAYLLQTVAPTPALSAENVEDIDLLEEAKLGVATTINEKTVVDLEKIPTNVNDNKADQFSAPDIKTALKEAFSSPTFFMITLGFSVCGFHVAFIGTHLPAYLVRGAIMIVNYLHSNNNASYL